MIARVCIVSVVSFAIGACVAAIQPDPPRDLADPHEMQAAVQAHSDYVCRCSAPMFVACVQASRGMLRRACSLPSRRCSEEALETFAKAFAVRVMLSCRREVPAA
jgi:hypothetical protein